MRFSEVLRLVFINLIQNKFKVILTSIGIIVGSATIVLVIAIGQGSKEEVAEQFKTLNAGAIDITFSPYIDSSTEDNNSSSEQSMPNSNKDTNTPPQRSESSDSSSTPPQMSEGADGSGSPPQMSESSDSSGTPPQMSESSDGSDSPPQMSEGADSSASPPQTPDGADNSSRSNSANEFTKKSGESGSRGGKGFFSQFGNSANMQDTVTLTTTDAEAIDNSVDGITATTISFSTMQSVEGGELDEATTYTLAGVLENYAAISNLSLSLGDFITEENNEDKEKVCVLGYDTAIEIFGDITTAYDSTIYIDSRPYVVNGILSQVGTVASGISPDTTIFIPYETGIKYITGQSVNPTITVISADVNNIETVKDSLELCLSETYPDTIFTLTDAGSKMEAATASNEILTILLIAMATIVFLVGGIGIMNVLFVSVKERTKEIGILKSMGCSKKDILLEFLFEACFISVIGGVLGVILSLILTPILKYFNVQVSLSVIGGLLAILFAIFTGTIFGFYPAFKASRLIPIEALSEE